MHMVLARKQQHNIPLLWLSLHVASGVTAAQQKQKVSKRFKWLCHEGHREQVWTTGTVATLGTLGAVGLHAGLPLSRLDR